jgi:hypothetical protein
LHKRSEAPNGGVDAAARIHERIAGSVKLQNTLPPLASSDLFDAALKGRHGSDMVITDARRHAFRSS